MPTVAHVAKQVVRGLPYLKKELARQWSLKTGTVMTTPTTYYVIFSGKCNLACSFCTIYQQVEPILTAEAMFRIVREAKSLSGSGFNISLSGGEPTIFKPLYDTLKLAQELGVNFGFTTNALALTKDNVRRLLSYDPFNINVSLESVDPKINEALRPAHDGTARTLRGIDHIMAEKDRLKARLSVIVKPTIMEQNYRGFPDLVRHFGKNSRVQVNFQPFIGKDGDRHWPQDLNNVRKVLDELLALQAEGYSVVGNPDSFQGFIDYFKAPPSPDSYRHLDLGGEKRNCDIGLRSMFVYPNGDVFFCEYLGKPIGNIYKQSLSDIYYSVAATEQRSDMVYCDIDCQNTCKRPTPLWVKAKTFIKMG